MYMCIRTGNSLNNCLVHPKEKLSYDENSTVRFTIIKCLILNQYG